MAKKEIDIQAYRDKLVKQVESILEKPQEEKPDEEEKQQQTHVTADYEEFRKAYIPKNLSFYEKLCNFSQKTLNVGVDKKTREILQKQIDTCHLHITPEGVTSSSFLVPIFFLMGILLLSGGIPIITGAEPSLFFIGIGFLIALIMIIPLQKLPKLMAENWRMRASNQMVLAIFYIVSYMRHTSNMEWAVDFAAEHLEPPLSLDLKKVIWNLHTRKYNSLKESLDNYLIQWRESNLEFVEAIHLIESSLYETSEDRRIGALEKSLNLMLEETFEKMLHFAQNLKGPLTTLHMLGVVLPILGLVVLPLMVSFMGGVKWYHIATLYNVILPFTVYYMGRVLLSKRPSGYGESNIESKPGMSKYKNVIFRIGNTEFLLNPLSIALLIFSVFFIIGILPLVIHAVDPNAGTDTEFDIVYLYEGGLMTKAEVEDDLMIRDSFLGYKTVSLENGGEEVQGPFGIGSTILGILFILGIGLSIGTYFKNRTQNLIKIRNNAKELEKEFSGALFQLGNRMGDGLPAEMAFGKVAEVMEGTKGGSFFKLVSQNIQQLGMGLEEAIFDKKAGAVRYYPSNMIESSMKVLLESGKKGSKVASKALINVSEYIKQIRRVDERLKDLMADVISSMQSQIAFLTPAIAGIVVGITSMIGSILGSINDQLHRQIFEGQDNAALDLLAGMQGGVPAYFFQIIVGLYVVQIGIVLTVLVNGILNGSDNLNERYMIGKNVLSSTILYVIITLIVVLVFNMISGNIMGELQL